jgi:2-polyprenyl-3-methyl-5-hydroxy-6-metoxy-1,4-benzoquinol methylase
MSKTFKNNHGLVYNNDLTGESLNAILSVLESKQNDFLNRFLVNIPLDYKAKWPIDKLHWWSRPSEYIYVYENILNENNINQLKILEFGPGCSFLTKTLIEELNLSTYFIEDIDIDVLSFWKQVGSELNCNVYPNVLDTLSEEIYFDVIFSVSVLEHTKDPFNEFIRLLNRLKVGGKIILTLDIDSTGRYGLNKEVLNKILCSENVLFEPVPLSRVNLNCDVVATPRSFGFTHKRATVKNSITPKSVIRFIKKIIYNNFFREKASTKINVLQITGTKIF